MFQIPGYSPRERTILIRIFPKTRLFSLFRKYKPAQERDTHLKYTLKYSTA